MGQYGGASEEIRDTADKKYGADKKAKKKKARVSKQERESKKKELKEKKKKEKEAKKAKARKKNEMKLLEKELKKGKDIDKIDFRKLDKKLDKMPIGVTTDEEEDSEEDEKPEKKKTVVKEKITDKKMLQKYSVDREDYMLQYADADEKPVFYEEYMPKNYKCFQGIDEEKWNGDVFYTFKYLLKYTNEVYNSHTAPTLDHFPRLLFYTEKLRNTSEYTNFCFNPLQAMRAWGLLHKIAQNKTAAELKVFINNYTNPFQEIKKIKKGEAPSTSEDPIHKELLALHRTAEFRFDGCVRLFTELPHHLEPVDTECRRRINCLYGGKSTRAGIQHHCFATDSDGFYSCYRINEEMSLSTRGAVRYVVPENCAPNWRASVALASAADCTFYWKSSDADETPNFLFNYPDGTKSKCMVISANANLAWTKGLDEQDVYRLESHLPDVLLYIFVEHPSNYQSPKSFPSDLATVIMSPQTVWSMKNNQRVHLPKSTTSMPISLFDHSKHNGLSRIYCSEKSELKQMKTSKQLFSGSPQYTTLFDHYHKTVFEICSHPPDNSGVTREFDVLAPEKAHQCIEESTAKLFGKFQKKTKKSLTRTEFFTYHEDQIHHAYNSMDFVEDGFEFFRPKATEIDLAKPFYYVMTRKFQESQMIVCSGYFNNTIWPIQKMQSLPV